MYFRSICLLLGVMALLRPWSGIAAEQGGRNQLRDSRPEAKVASDTEIADRVTVGGLEIRTVSPCRGLVVRKDLGVLTVPWIDGQVIHRARGPEDKVLETRAVITPCGDYLLMFPEGQHYGGSRGKRVNQMLACRSTDKGKTWQGPSVAFDIDYSQHGFVPLAPRGSRRIYAFGTQPIPGKYSWENGQQENAPIGYRWSDDDGRTWSDVTLIRPTNDPEFKGMSVMRMCETGSGAWLIGAHASDWSKKPLQTRQYLLRSEDRGKTWTVLPDKRPNGWFAVGFNRMDEGRPISLGGERVLAMFRTPQGHLWTARSEDDGKTWTKPAPSPLVHPDAPPMLFHLADGKTLVAFHHNRHSQTQYQGLTAKMEGMKDRSELWVATSTDEGRTWSEPRFVLANAVAPNLQSLWQSYQCSYADLIVDGDDLHLFIPHRWQRVLHLVFCGSDLRRFPTRVQIAGARGAAGPGSSGTRPEAGDAVHAVRTITDAKPSLSLRGGVPEQAADGTTTISVLDFGAIPNDDGDDGPAVRAAVAACRKALHPCLVFPQGVYHFRAESTRSTALVEFNDLPEITVCGDKAELVGSGTKTLFLFQRCGQVTVSGLDVDWDPLPFTAGRVVAGRADSIDIEIVPPHPLRGDSPVQSLIAFDHQRRIPLGSSDPGYFQLTQKAYGKKAEIIGPKRLRIYLSPKPEILRTAMKGQRGPAVGSYVLALYRVRGGAAFRPFGCGDVRFENDRVFATLGMGFAMNTCDRVSLDRCQVVIKPGSGRWMSSTVDATHCNMVRQRVEYADCRFEGMGDDAINVHGMYSMVHERPNARTIVLRGWKSIFNEPVIKDDFAAPAQNSLRPGELLEFGTKANPLVPAFTARIVQSTPVIVKGVTLKRVGVDRDLPDYVQAGSIVADTAEIPQCRIRGCTMRGGRGCGVRLKTRDAVVENCTFEDIHGAGVWITCDAEVDHESIAARNVAIRNNLFRRISPAISASAGRKEVYPDVHTGIVISGNRIEAAPRQAISLRSTKGALICDNVISSAAPEPIDVTLSSEVRLEDNRIVPLTKEAVSNGKR